MDLEPWGYCPVSSNKSFNYRAKHQCFKIHQFNPPPIFIEYFLPSGGGNYFKNGDHGAEIEHDGGWSGASGDG